MAIGLFTSRIVLQTLGVEDYGVYNVVGGMVTTLAIFNSALTAATQRFLSFELGKGVKENIQKTFSASVSVHIVLALVCFLLAESIGVWFLNAKLNIEPDRLSAANWVLQCSIVTFCLNILSIPYNAMIVAHEKMSAFAYISLFESVLKFGIAITLLFISFDKLIIYACLQMLTAIIIRVSYQWYCRKKIENTEYHPQFDKELFKRMLSFTNWSLIGNIGFTMKDPLLNITINLFFGTLLNAARGVAIQANSIINSFAVNLGMAMNPQIVKSYAAKDYGRCMELVYTGARISFFLITLISIPILINIDKLLSLWLVEVPEYTRFFFYVVLFSSLMSSLSNTSSVAVQATGNIKVFSIGVCLILFSEVPIAYCLFKASCSIYTLIIPVIISSLVSMTFRYYVLHKLIDKFSYRKIYVTVVLRCILVFILSAILSFLIHKILPPSLPWVFLSVMSSLGVSGFFIYAIGLSGDERRQVSGLIFSKLENVRLDYFKQLIWQRRKSV